MKTKLVITLLVVVYIILQIIPKNHHKNDNAFIVDKGEPPLVIAHGGGKLLNPENTWMAFDHAYDLNVDVLEIDLHLTSDNILVSYHNDTLDGLSNMTGTINDYTYDELKKGNFGQHFVALDGSLPYKDLSVEELESYGNKLSPASLEEMFIKYGKDVLYIVEIKDSNELGIKAVEELVSLIDKYQMEEYSCIASFDQEVIDHALTIKSDLMINSFDFTTSLYFVIASIAGVDYFTNYPHHGLQLPLEEYNIPLDTSYLINKIHRHGNFVHYWTINDEKDMQKCIDNHADGIITDRPDLLIPLIEKNFK